MRKQLFVAYIQGDTQNSTGKCLQHLALTGPALSRMTSRGRLQLHDHVASLIFLYVCSVLLFIKDRADGKDAATQSKNISNSIPIAKQESTCQQMNTNSISSSKLKGVL